MAATGTVASRTPTAARSLVRTGADLLTLARPPQWPKNLLVVPLALAGTPPWTAAALLRTGWAVVLFCLASSLVYVVNDISDRELDRAHPRKRHRPVAQGRVPVPGAWLYAAGIAVLLAAAVAVGPAIPWWPLAAYVALNLAYSRWLKHVPLLDIYLVAAGFGLRVLLGYGAAGGRVSGWLLIAVLTACLVLAAGKRRHELVTAGPGHRPALRGYSVALTDQLLAVNAILAVLTFLLYLRFDAPVGTHQDTLLMVAAPLALFGVFRYLQAVLVRQRGGDPVRTLLRDKLILADAALLAAAVGLALSAGS